MTGGNHAIFAVLVAEDDRRSARHSAPAFNTVCNHRVEIDGRAADDLEHVAGRGLVVERFLQIVGAWRNSVRSRAFSMAITAWAAKFSTSSICFSVKGRTCG